jgi:hypothetical protein
MRRSALLLVWVVACGPGPDAPDPGASDEPFRAGRAATADQPVEPAGGASDEPFTGPGSPAEATSDAPFTGAGTPEAATSDEPFTGPSSPRAPEAPRRSRFDPPATLGHLDATPSRERAEIDRLIGVLLDPEAGRASHEAMAALAAIGKPAFPPLLGATARIRDVITDNDTMEERLLEASLMLADHCLREMDGYLDEHGKQVIRPGTDRKYIAYILRLHYRRWVEVLAEMPEMPGPFR